jgi:hypothetical protein
MLNKYQEKIKKKILKSRRKTASLPLFQQAISCGLVKINKIWANKDEIENQILTANKWNDIEEWGDLQEIYYQQKKMNNLK